MKTNLKFYFLPVQFFLMAIGFCATAPSEKVIILKCEAKHVLIKNIDILSLDGIYDADGKPIQKLFTGSTDLYVAGGLVSADELTSNTIASALSKRNEWKRFPHDQDYCHIVGLDIKPNCFLILFMNQWLLLNIYQSNISVVNVKVIIERGEFKVFTAMSSEAPISSNDPKLVSIFEGLK